MKVRRGAVKEVWQDIGEVRGVEEMRGVGKSGLGGVREIRVWEIGEERVGNGTRGSEVGTGSDGK